MPKEFSTWVSEMSNSIEDKSNFIKNNTCNALGSVTTLQARLIIADSLVHVDDSESLFNWLSVFRVGINLLSDEDEGVLIRLPLFPTLVARHHAVDYYECIGWEDEKIWFAEFRRKIISGEI